jgi:hypothetical protein
VKKGLYALCTLSAIFLLCSCALFPRRAVQINWPEKIDYMEALCELDMAWKGMNYSGSMALKLDYPDKFQVEVYGPFGETIMYLKKDGQQFLLTAGDETFTNEVGFEQKFNIRLSDFMDDLALRGSAQNGRTEKAILKDRYKVLYNLTDQENKICWEGQEGRICVRFLEARFSKE